MPTTLEALDARRQHLARSACLVDADDDHRRKVDTLILSMRLATEGSSMGESTIKATNAMFRQAVENCPLWAIQAAIARITSGRTITPIDPAYPVKPAQFALEVRKGMEPLQIEWAEINEVLDAEVMGEDPPEVRAAAIERYETEIKPMLMNALSPNEIGRMERKGPPGPPEDPVDKLARLQHENEKLPISVGFELSQKLLGPAKRGTQR